MDQIEKQKVQSFLISIDQKIKEIKDFLELAKGELVLEEISKYEEENAEFLRFNSAYQDELNKRKWIVQYLIFPIIADDKVEELLQYHLLEAIDIGLDPEELMKMRAITISELLWPKISQQYLKALAQNTQLIGSEPILIEGEKSTYLPYVKNWISVYNRRFGIEKHSGLEPHQFVLENTNAKRLNKGQKETLLKILKFYESLKVISLSEIEGELRKMKMGAVVPASPAGRQQAAAYSISTDATRGRMAQLANTSKIPPLSSKEPISVLKPISDKPTILDKRIKIIKAKYQEESKTTPVTEEPLKSTRVKVENQTKPKENEDKTKEREVIEKSITELLETFPPLKNYNITSKSIALPTAPFSLAPTAENWIDYYHKECGKGRHSPQERDSFIENLKKNQGLGPDDALKLKKILRSADEKNALPYDKKNKELLLDLVKVGEKLKIEEEDSEDAKISKELDKIIPKKTEKPEPALRRELRSHTAKEFGKGAQSDSIKKIEPVKKDEGYLEIELVPGGVAEEKTSQDK